MQTEFTGRQVVLSKKLRAQSEAGLARIERMLGKEASAHVVLTAEKYRKTAEVTIKTKHLDIVGLCESPVMETALHDALAKAEKQVLKHADRLRTQKRKPKEEKLTAEAVSPRPRKHTSPETLNGEAEPATASPKKANGGTRLNGSARTNGNGHTQPTIPVLVHSFPTRALIQEPHILRSRDSVALRPMSLEEAVKEAEFRDRDVFVFRDNAGALMVLHRKRDGKMELIEAPM